MVNQYVWIILVISVFFAGISGGYVIFLNSSQPDVLENQSQIIQQLMMQSPQHRQFMIDQIIQNPEMRNQMMDTITKDSEQMNRWMANTEHVNEMTKTMKESHEFMMEMMSEIMNEPELRLQMIGHMTENTEAMQIISQMIGKDGTMMHSGSMISPGLMQKNMTGNMMSSGMQGQGMMMNQDMIQIMQDPETREKMIEIMTEYVDQMQELLSSEITDEEFNEQMSELIQQNMQKMQELMSNNNMNMIITS